MPMKEFRCEVCQETEELFLWHWDDPVPVCFHCGRPRTEIFSGFAVPFSGSVHKYMDSKREGGDRDGFWAYKRQSSISGQPEPIWLDTMQAVREFNKAEGLAAPGEVPTYATISADGKRIMSAGMPGQWSGLDRSLIPSRVWEMDKSTTSLRGKDPAPMSSGPACTAQAVDASTMESFTSGAGMGG